MTAVILTVALAIVGFGIGFVLGRYMSRDDLTNAWLVAARYKAQADEMLVRVMELEQAVADDSDEEVKDGRGKGFPRGR